MQNRLAILGALLVSALAAPGAAAADPPPSAVMEARTEAREFADAGLKLYQAGRYGEALATFTEAERRFSAPTIRLMIARTLHRLGRLLDARAAYQRIVDEKLEHYAPPVFFEAKEEAKTELLAVQGVIPTLRITVAGAPGGKATLTLDGAEVRSDRSIAADPGSHTIVAKAPGREPMTRQITLKAGSVEEVAIAFPSPPRRAPATATPIRTVLADGAQESPAGGPNPYVIGGGVVLGTALLAMGTGFLVAGISAGKERDKLCDPGQPEPCDAEAGAAEQWVGLDRTRSKDLTIGTWMFIGAGIVGVSTTAYVVSTWNSGSGKRAGARLQGKVTPAGLVLSGSW